MFRAPWFRVARRWLSVLSWGILFGVAGCVSARVPDGDAITIVAPVTAWTWPMYIAERAGYYEKYGLNVNLEFANHPAGLAMLTSGQAEVNVNSLQQAMQVVPKQEDLIVIGSPVTKWLFALMGEKDLSAADLRGKRLGVAQIGDATYYYAIALLARFGLDPTDVEIVVTGADGRAAALAGKRIDATMLSAPAYFALEKEGFESLANIFDYDDLHTPSVLMVKKATVEQNPSLPEILIEAHAEATRRFYEDGPFAVQAFLNYDKQAPKDVERVYGTYVRGGAFERIPYISAESVRYVIDNAPDPRLASEMKAFSYNAAIDNDTVDRLLESGFFATLFGESVGDEGERRRGEAFR